MTIESVTYIDDLDDNYPAYNDQKKEGDDHIRNIKTALTNSFPNISGAVLPTHTELNFVDGVTSGIQGQFTALDARLDTLEVINPEYLTKITSDVQDQLDAKLAKAGGTMAGSINMGSYDITNCDVITCNDSRSKHISYQSIGNHEITSAVTDEIDLSVNSHIFVDMTYNSSGMGVSVDPEYPGFVTLVFWNGTGSSDTFTFNVPGVAWGDSADGSITAQNFSTYHRFAFTLDNANAALLVLFWTGYYYVLIGGAKLGGDSYDDPVKANLDPNS